MHVCCTDINSLSIFISNACFPGSLDAGISVCCTDINGLSIYISDSCFPGSLDAGVSVCCTDINGLSKCEAESTCTFIKAGCIFDCSAFSGNSTTCNVVPGCIHVPLLGTCVTVADPM